MNDRHLNGWEAIVILAILYTATTTIKEYLKSKTLIVVVENENKENE